MRALQYEEYGEPDVLRWAEAPEPHAGAGQVRITVKAASVNPADWKALSGARAAGKPLEGTAYIGYDAAGVVDEVGDGVSGVSVGDEVFGRGLHTQAEKAVLSAWAVKPPSVDWAVAAAAGVAGETSERALRLLGVKEGDTLFVDGAAGGDQVDAVFDVAGKTPIEELVSLVSEPSRVLTIANFEAAGSGIQVTGGGSDSRPAEAMAELADLLAQNKVVVKIQTFPFERAVEAYRISRSGHVRGKLVLVP